MTRVSADVVSTLLADAALELAAAGVESPRWDAEQLLAYALGRSRAELVLAQPSDDELAQFRALVARRAQRVPLQHLTGRVGFRYIDLDVGPGVFIPRPETEVVAGLAIDAARAAGERPVVVDLCSGSGAIALSVAHEVPGARVHAVELDADALEWLRRNALARESAGDVRTVVHHGDALSGAPRELDHLVDVVVTNPPYVADGEMVLVAPEVRDHDPRHALVAGGDGLDVIRDVIRAAERLLRPGGVVVIEHADRQGETCPALLTDRAGWTGVADHADLTGRPRCTTAVWRP